MNTLLYKVLSSDVLYICIQCIYHVYIYTSMYQIALTVMQINNNIHGLNK